MPDPEPDPSRPTLIQGPSHPSSSLPSGPGPERESLGGSRAAGPRSRLESPEPKLSERTRSRPSPPKARDRRRSGRRRPTPTRHRVPSPNGRRHPSPSRPSRSGRRPSPTLRRSRRPRHGPTGRRPAGAGRRAGRCPRRCGGRARGRRPPRTLRVRATGAPARRAPPPGPAAFDGTAGCAARAESSPAWWWMIGGAPVASAPATTTAVPPFRSRLATPAEPAPLATSAMRSVVPAPPVAPNAAAQLARGREA